MDNRRYLQQLLNKLRMAFDFLQEGIDIINEMLGGYEAAEDLSSWRRAQLRFVAQENPFARGTSAPMRSVGEADLDLQRQKKPSTEGQKTVDCVLGVSYIDIKKEIEEMLITLNINGSLRLRKDGLYELRTKYGSVYGRTVGDLKGKLERKLADNTKKGSGRSAPSAPKKPTEKKRESAFPLLSEFYEKNYIPYKSQTIKPPTIKRIGYNFDYIRARGFNLPMNEYTPKNITEFLLSIPETRKRQIMQGLLNNIFKFAVQMDVVERCPTEHIVKMKHSGNVGTAFSLAEQRAFFRALFEDTECSYARKCYLLFVYLTGARRNEALNLRVEDVGEVLHLPGTKTEGSDRYLPMLPIVKRLLDGLTPAEDGRYFPFSSHIAKDLFRRYSPNAHKLHDLRHTYGTLLICVDKLDAKTVSLYMGHSTVETTLKYYTHPEQLDRALFLNGELSPGEKVERMRAEYAEIKREIADFIR